MVDTPSSEAGGRFYLYLPAITSESFVSTMPSTDCCPWKNFIGTIF
jgi:hypothetical protein